MSPPSVSVLIPTFNYARYLPEAVESVLAQDFPDYELLISDDASTDDSARVLAGYSGRDARVRTHVHPQNLGMVANWNWCLRQARGQYIKFLFGDDRLNGPTALGTLVALLAAHPSAVMAVSARTVIDERSRTIDLWDRLGRSGLHRGTEVMARCLQANGNLIGEPSVVLFRKAAAARGFDTDFRQLVDLEMWFHLLQSGDLVYTRHPACSFRYHPKQQTAVNRQERHSDREGLWLVGGYWAKAGLPEVRLRGLLFHSLYHARKRKAGDTRSLLTLTDLWQRLGHKWYALYWLRRRVTRPFLDCQHLVRKLRGRCAHARATHEPAS